MPELAELDWIAILISTFVAGGLGALWYSPRLFGEAWLAERGVDPSELAAAGPAISGSVASCFVAAVSIAMLITGLEAFGIARGLGVGALVGFGVVAMTMLSQALFESWSLRLYLIQAGYRVVYLLLMGAIYGARND